MPRRALILPAQRTDAVGTEANDRDIAFPAAVPARVIELGASRGQADHVHGDLGDLGDSDIVPGRDVEYGEGLLGQVGRVQDGLDDIVDVDVRLALLAVTQDAQVAAGRREAGG